MGDNDKPFVCTYAGCNMRFTNEDHLSVHRMKHEMSLTLTPGAKSGLFTLADQTPTPTKFLKNCEEIGLFNELTKNPFEEAFKKASETLSEGKIIEVVNMAFPGLESESLNTPTPTTHMTSHCPVICVKTPNKEPEYIPLPGPDTDMGSTIATTPGGSSSTCGTPQSQASTPRKSSSTPAGTPTSSMALPFKLRLKRERENELSMMSGGQSPSVPKKDVVPEERTVPKPDSSSSSGLSQSEPVSNAGPVPGSTSVSAIANVTNPARIAMVTPTPVVSSVAVPTTNNSVSSSILPTALQDAISSSGATVPSGVTAAGVPYMCVAPGKQPQCYLQVMIQMPGGEMVPVQIPAAISQAAQTVASATAPLATSAVMTNQAPVTSTVVAASRTTQRVTSTGGAASTATKQKLKAALQQSVLSNNLRIMTEAVDRVATEPMIQNSPASLKNSLSPISVKTTPTSYRTQNLPKMSINSQQMSPVSSVTTPISDIGDLDDDDDLDDMMDEDGDEFFSSKKSRRGEGPDPDDRRKKFLERNRAAAARCRQKKKMWVTNLEKKASDLQNSNSKLQQEVTALRSEVAQLKTLLLAHKDCPITQKLQGGAIIKAEMDTSRQHTSCTVSTSYANTTSPHPNQSHTANAALLSPTGSQPTDDNIAGSSRVIHSVSSTSTTSSVLRTIQSVAPFVIEFK